MPTRSHSFFGAFTAFFLAVTAISGSASGQISNLIPRTSPDDVCGNIGEILRASPRTGLVQVFWPGGQPAQRLRLPANRRFSIDFFVRNCLGRDLTRTYQLQFYAWENAFARLSGPLRDRHIEQQLRDSVLLGSFPLRGKVEFSNNLIVDFDANDARGTVSLVMPRNSAPGAYTIIGCPTRVRGLNGRYALTPGIGASLVCGPIATISVPATDDVGGGPSRLDWAVTRVRLTKADSDTLNFARKRTVLVTLENTGRTAVPSFGGFVVLELIDRVDNRVLESWRIAVGRDKLTRPGDRVTVSRRITVPTAFTTVKKYRNRDGTVRGLQVARLRARLLTTSLRDSNSANNSAARDISLTFAPGCEIVLQWMANPRNWNARVGQSFGVINWDFINLGDAACPDFIANPVRRQRNPTGWTEWQPLLETGGTVLIRRIPRLSQGQFVSVSASDRFVFGQPGLYQYGILISGDLPDQNIANHQGENVAVSFLVLQ